MITQETLDVVVVMVTVVMRRGEIMDGNPGKMRVVVIICWGRVVLRVVK